MVHILKRMSKLRQKLLKVRIGPGAALLPPNVSKIDMQFAFRYNDGHFGPRKFWRFYLPSLKYYNPSVPMLVERNSNNEGPATMTITFNNETGPTTKEISMKHRHANDIWSDFLAITQAKPLQPSPEDVKLEKEFQERAEKTKRDLETHQRVKAEKERKEHIQAQIRAGLMPAQ